MARGSRRKCQWISCAGVISLTLAAAYAPPAMALVSSGNGTIINDLVGSDRFYINGYTGANSVVANVEGGYIWGGASDRHQDMQPSPRYGTFFGTGTLSTHFDAHATAVGQIIGGNGSDAFQQGIAKGATVWSGAIATGWNTALTFGVSPSSFLPAYIRAMKTDPNDSSFRTADVVSSSWGFQHAVNSVPNSTGYNFYSMAIDGLANQNRFTTVVIGAGNNGNGVNKDVLAPGDGYNSITVGALGNESTGYASVSGFSSRGPSDFAMPAANPANVIITKGVRASIDIVAPGENLKLAFYGGNTGGNANGANTPGTNLYSPNQFGTSYSTPIVSGGVALLTDAGRALFGGVNSGTSDAVDARITKAVLLNSADKIQGWNNGQSVAGGVITTTQSLDYASGAGRMNLSRAFDQYTLGAHNFGTPVAGNQGAVGTTGWDYGLVTEQTPTDYVVSALAAGSTFTLTLCWNVDRALVVNELNVGTSQTYDDSFDDLDLQVWSTGVNSTLVAQSSSEYNNVEHLSFLIPSTGQYMIRVLWSGELYDFVNDANGENFGLAWSNAAVPEPASLGLMVLAGVMLRRSRSRSAA